MTGLTTGTDKTALPSALERLLTLIDEGEELVEGACGALRELLAEARLENFRIVKAVVPAQVELVKALRQARETEKGYHDWCSRNSGELAHGQIDFGRLRGEVGERLDHLREKMRSRGLSERAE